MIIKQMKIKAYIIQFCQKNLCDSSKVINNIKLIFFVENCDYNLTSKLKKPSKYIISCSFREGKERHIQYIYIDI